MRHARTHQEFPPNLLPAATLPSLPSSAVPSSIANFPAGLAHDARNMLAAMDIYCELLAAPGVLNPQYSHLAPELRLLRDNSCSLLDRLLHQVVKTTSEGSNGTSQFPGLPLLHALGPERRAAVSVEREQAARSTAATQEATVRKPVADTASEITASHKMLSALAGPKVQVEVVTLDAPCGELLIPSVDFTRILINLVRNAAEAMGTGGRILISARAAPPEAGMRPAVLVSVEDNGPGIPLSLLERIFELNTAAAAAGQHTQRMNFRPRGLGLRIVRELVEGGGGAIRAARLPERGSRFEILLPMAAEIADEV